MADNSPNKCCNKHKKYTFFTLILQRLFAAFVLLLKDLAMLRNTILLSGSLLILLSSCSTEMKFAREFSRQSEDITLLALRTDHIFKINEKYIELPAGERPSDAEIDSLRYYQTLVIQYLESKEADEDVLNHFFQTYTSELVRYGVQVYHEENLEAFFEVDSNAYIINLAQVELDEFDYHIEESAVYGGRTWAFDYWINALRINTWFELSRLNPKENESPQILYASNELYDEFEGYFNQQWLTGEVSYVFSHDTIDMNRFYEFMGLLGRLYAAYTYDYLLNTYLDNNIEEEKRSNLWYRYNPYRKSFFISEDDRFIPLED